MIEEEQRMNKPTLTPIEALTKVLDIGFFSCEGFFYNLDEDGESAFAEDLKDGRYWATSGDYAERVTVDAEWISLL
jgi:hypothetical protein